MAVQAYVKITGAKQGQFKGEGTQKAPTGAGAIPLVRFLSSAAAPRDRASGQASGKRQWQPIRITKEWGASSPQLLQALTTNEQIKTAVFEFYQSDRAGKVQLHYRITLHNASISSITSSVDLTVPTGAPYAGHELEDVELTFQSITVEDIADKTTATDDWQAVEGIAADPQPVLRAPIRPVAPA